MASIENQTSKLKDEGGKKKNNRITKQKLQRNVNYW